MKERITYFLALCLLVTASCQERHPALFDDISGVYFNNLSATNSLVDSIDITFVYEMKDEMTVPVRVQLLGRTSSVDRKVDISVRSEDALEGVDYLLPQEALIRSGESYTDYLVTLKRTPALKTRKKTIELEVHENEHFTLPVRQMAQISDTVSTLIFRITFSDMFVKAPSAWDSNLVGEFTQQKFELICRVLEIDPDDFNDNSRITLAKLVFISTEMTYYVREQVQKKRNGQPYDEQAFDPVTGEGLDFTDKK